VPQIPDLAWLERGYQEQANILPEDKFNLSPESLNIPGDNYKGLCDVCVDSLHRR
jgi:hypothetical protein